MTQTIGRAALATASLAALAAVVACGGGGGGGGQANLPGGTSSYASASFTVAVPSSATTSSTQRTPKFISPNAQSITIAVSGAGSTPTTTSGITVTANLTASSPNCTAATATAPLTCIVSLNSPVGNDTFDVSLFAGLNGTGSMLGASLVSATIGGTGVTTVPVTLGGIVASIGISFPNGSHVVPGGYATSVPMQVMAKDASGAQIVGSSPYANPITLSNMDTSGITALSTTNVTSPSTVVTLAYAPTDANSGVLDFPGQPVGQTTINASANGVATSAITPGIFQYIADRFFGLGHTRTLTGTASTTVVTYNGAGVPSPNPSAWAYNVSEALTVHGNQTFSSVPAISSHFVTTYTQSSPLPAAAPEVVTQDVYRGYTATATGANVYRLGELESDVNSGAGQSPVTANPAGTTNLTYTYPAPGAWQEDVLPHSNGATWTNSLIPYTIADTGAQVSTFQLMADGSTTFNETSPGTLVQSQAAAGTASNVNNGFTTTIGAPSSGTIPVAEQTTSPCCGAVTNFTPADWYPGGAAPVTPTYTSLFSEVIAPIPGGCNVPATLATQAFVVVQTNTQLDTAIFRNRQEVWSDYFVPDGIGFVCEVYALTSSSYRFTTGIIASQTTFNYTVGVQNATSLSLIRRP